MIRPGLLPTLLARLEQTGVVAQVGSTLPLLGDPFTSPRPGHGDRSTRPAKSQARLRIYFPGFVDISLLFKLRKRYVYIYYIHIFLTQYSG